MKRNRILITVFSIIMLGTVVLTILYFVLSSNNSPTILKLKIAMNCDSYKDKWRLSSLRIDEDARKVRMEFRFIFYDYTTLFLEEDVAMTPLVCEEISNYLFSDVFRFKEDGYQLDFRFADGQLFHLEVQNVEPEMKNICLKLPDRSYFPISKYSEWYPETESLDIYRIDDDALAAIGEFTNLKYIITGTKLTEEQKEDILSRIPDVEIGQGIYR